MSTTNTETLKLYKNTKLYNGSRYQFFLTNRASAFQTFLGTPDYTTTVTYKSISEPIPLNKEIRYCDEYTYGSITNEGKTYYFFVDSIITDAYKQTTLTFTIDWWTTNWANINCTKAHLTRKHSKPGYMAQPYTPLNVSTTTSVIGSTGFVYMATYIPSFGSTSEENLQSFISTLILEGTEYNTKVIEQGNWYQRLGVAGADVKDCFVVPMYDYSFFTGIYDTYYTVYTSTETPAGLLQAFNERFPTTTLTSGLKLLNMYSSSIYTYNITDSRFEYSTGLNYVMSVSTFIRLRGSYDSYTGSYSECLMAGYQFAGYDTTKTVTLSNTITTTETTAMGVVDWNGNEVWRCPYGKSVSSFRTRLLIGISHIMIQFTPYGQSDIDEQLSGMSFMYDCRHPGLFVDSYQDYVLKNREYDIAMRKIQSDKQLWTSAASIAENVGFGMAFGGSSGAKAAGIGGVIETIGTYVINAVFDPQIQNQYDIRYQNMTDQISLIGDSITSVYQYVGTGLMRMFTQTMDSATQTRMDNDTTYNGYYCDETTGNLQSLFLNGRIFQADNVVVEGACTLAGKQQVVRRLMNGVEFI